MGAMAGSCGRLFPVQAREKLVPEYRDDVNWIYDKTGDGDCRPFPPGVN